MHLVSNSLKLYAYCLQNKIQIVCCWEISHFQGASADNVHFCDTHGSKLDLVSAKIHIVNDNMHFVMPVCILSVTDYVLTELMGAMDGLRGDATRCKLSLTRCTL